MSRRNATKAKRAADEKAGRRTRRPTARGGKDVVRPIGRPTALTPAVEEALLGYLMKGNSITDACALAGVNRTSFHRWMQRGEDARETLDTTGTLDPTEELFRDFRDSVLDAQAQASSLMVGYIFQGAAGGFITSEEPVVSVDGVVQTDPVTGEVLWKRSYTPPNPNVAMKYLQVARAKDWSLVAANQSVTHTVQGPGGGPVEVAHSVDEIASLSARMQAIREQFAEDAADGWVTDDTAAMLPAATGDTVPGEVVDPPDD